MSRRQAVLVIDHDPDIRQLVQAWLSPMGVEVHAAASGREGLEIAQKHQPDLILLDVSLSDMSGFDLCALLRSDSFTGEIPIIFLTEADDPEQKVRGFNVGAVDYVTKPTHPQELQARVRAALRTRALVETLELQAQTDTLTRLPNRHAFQKAVGRCIERARRADRPYKYAILFLDLDRFKVINDSLGHAIGDELLIYIAQQLQRCLRGTGRQESGVEDIVARMGGDEFTILLDDIPDFEVATEIAERLQYELSRPVNLSGYQVTAGVSIGIKLCEGADDTADALLRDSDTAMYHAKAAGRGKYVIFDNQMYEEAVDRLELETDLRRALYNWSFEQHYQPIVRLDDGQLVGFEALARWNHPTRGSIGPHQFITIAEETGLVLELGRRLMEDACRRLKLWQDMAPGLPALHISLNVSRLQLSARGFVTELAGLLEDVGLDPRTLRLEITESAILHDSSSIVPVLREIRELGVRLAMDDFGTGNSSLSSLHRFPIDLLKIDESFIYKMDGSRAHAAIVHAIVTLAQNMGMEVVAEGIETREHLALLQALECTYAQGYLFGRPQPADAVDALLALPDRVMSLAS